MIRSLAPGFLIAAPQMDDPRFQRSVILLAEATDEGALGFVINRTTPFTFADLASDIGFDLDPEVETESVHYGGPVSPERGWVLFRKGQDEEREDVLQVAPNLHLAATLEVLGDFVTAKGDDAFQLLLGYAGWAPHQLEEELQSGAWLPLELDDELIFDVPLDERYDVALRKLGITPGTFVAHGGGDA